MLNPSAVHPRQLSLSDEDSVLSSRSASPLIYSGPDSVNMSASSLRGDSRDTGRWGGGAIRLFRRSEFPRKCEGIGAEFRNLTLRAAA